MKRVIVLLALLAVTFVTGCSSPGGGTAAPSKATLILDWVPNTNHSGFFVALDKGWYREQGLDLEIQTPSDPAAGLKQVAYGHSEFAVSFQEETTIARAQGIPVVSIAAILQHNTSAFVSLKAKGIVTPSDFQGRRYASTGAPLERAIVTGLLACDGSDINKVEMVDVGFDVFPAIAAGNADIGWIFLGWDGIQAKLQGIELNMIPLYGSCVPDYYTPIIIAGETTLAKEPKIVKAFMAATSRGFQYAVDHPAEAADILLKHSPESDPELVRTSQEYLSPRYRADAARWGVQKAEVWSAFGKWMADNGLLAGPFDPAKAFTNDYLP